MCSREPFVLKTGPVWDPKGGGRPSHFLGVFLNWATWGPPLGPRADFTPFESCFLVRVVGKQHTMC